MGIFTRLFKGGQDGDDPGAATGNGIADDDEPEIAIGSAPVEQAKSDDAPITPTVTPMPQSPPDLWSFPPAPWEKRSTPPTPAASAPTPPAPPPSKPQLPAPKPAVRPAAAAAPAARPTAPETKPSKPEPSKPVEAAPAPTAAAPKPARDPKPLDRNPRITDETPRTPPLDRNPRVTDNAPRDVTIAPRTPPRDARDPTLVMSPPPAPAGEVKRAVPTPSPEPARRAHSDTLGAAFEAVIATAPQPGGVSTKADLAEVRGVFEQVAAIHVVQVRDVMLEVRYGEANRAWLELTRPALTSLRAMAAQMELTDLCSALDAFCATLETVVAAGGVLADDGKSELLRRYQRLVELIPQAFALDVERDRREPIIVEALLLQVDGVERLTVDKLLAVGLNRLEVLVAANAGDLAAVSGIRHELAAAIVERFKDYRTTTPTSVSALDPAAERGALADLLIALSLQNDDLVRASASWTDAARARKRELRKQREQTFQRIRVALARLGERDQLVKLDKLPYAERIATIDRYLSSQPKSRGDTHAKHQS